MGKRTFILLITLTLNAFAFESIPTTTKLVEVVQVQKGDVPPENLKLGDPATGKIWEVDPKRNGLVVGFEKIKPWKPAQIPTTLFEHLKKAQTLKPEAVKKK